jgi:ABC-type antimicrobial peptide transport system permease subunit
MNRLSLIISSLFYYWRSHVAVFLGVVAGTTVITGALIVGDSVRESLKQMSLDRLGDVDFVLHTPRFITAETARSLRQDPEFAKRFDKLAPALIMEGSLVRDQDDGTVLNRAGNINIVAIDESFADFSEFIPETIPVDDELIVSYRVAEEMAIKRGDKLKLWVELPSDIPRDTLMGDADGQLSREIEMTVTTVLHEDSGTGRFALNPSQQVPMTVFLSLEHLRYELDLQYEDVSRHFPQGNIERVNAFFVKAKTTEDATSETAVEAAELLTEILNKNLTLEDLGLRLVPQASRDYISLESEQLIISDLFTDAAMRGAKKLDWPYSRVMVYFGDEFTTVGKDDTLSMYSTIAAVDFDEVSRPPFGPLLPANAAKPKDFEVVVNDFFSRSLKIDVDDTMHVTYHKVGSHGKRPDGVTDFTVHSVVPMEGNATASDKGMTPNVPGVTDAKRFQDWKRQPFPLDLRRISAADNKYFEQHGPLPKCFVNLETASKLWKNRYGSLTSFRIAPRGDQDLDSSSADFAKSFLSELEPVDTGLIVRPVKYSGLQAASGTTDFSGLFFGFSFFVIASAMILIGLLFRLGVERRTKNIGLLQAVGLDASKVRKLFMIEGLFVATDGAILGSVFAIGYAKLMIAALKDPDWWGGAIGTKFLFVHVSTISMVAGFAIALFVAWLALFLALRGLRSLSTRQLLAGATEVEQTDVDLKTSADKHRKRAIIGIAFSAIVTVLGLAGIIPATEAGFGMSWQVIAFFVVGITLLVSALWFFSASLAGDRQSAIRGKGLSGISRLGFRNAARHRQRSILSTGLIASATFVIVAVASGQRNPSLEEADLDSGNGGYVLVGETATPILEDLNSKDGRNKADLSTNLTDQQQELLEQVTVTAFRKKPGENASCLNLYKTTLPTVLGVPDSQIERGGFRFINGSASDYWPLLKEEREDGLIPVLGDMNTLMFSLHKGPGDTIDVPNTDHKLVVVGMLDSSVFQGVLLMSDSNFQIVFPDAVAFRYFLIGATDQRAAKNPLSNKPEKVGGDCEVDTKVWVVRRSGSGDPRTAREHWSGIGILKSKGVDTAKVEVAAGFAGEGNEYEVPLSNVQSVTEVQELTQLFESKLTPFGMDIERVSDRIATFLIVQNTYLSTFQTLGGLGLLLGTLGLATVMLRNVVERRSELALMRAVGFRRSGLSMMVLSENAMLLVWGLAAGTVSALLAMLPHLKSVGADTPWLSGLKLLALVFGVGMLAAWFAVREASRTPIVSSLRSD